MNLTTLILTVIVIAVITIVYALKSEPNKSNYHDRRNGTQNTSRASKRATRVDVHKAKPKYGAFNNKRHLRTHKSHRKTHTRAYKKRRVSRSNKNRKLKPMEKSRD